MKKIYLLIILLSLCYSCKSKKKIVEKEKIEVSVSENLKEKEVVQNDIKMDSASSSAKEIKTNTETKDFEGEVADPTKPASVTTEEKDGKITQTFHNFKNVKSKTEDKKQQTKNTNSVLLSEVDKSKSDKSTEQSSEFEGSKNTRNTDSEVKGISPAIGLGIGLGFIVLLILVYRKWSTIKGWIS